MRKNGGGAGRGFATLASLALLLSGGWCGDPASLFEDGELPEPTPTPPLHGLTSSSWVELAAGVERVCGVLVGGAVRCFDLGRSTEEAVPGYAEGLSRLAVGVGACGLDPDGAVRCWRNGGDAPFSDAPEGLGFASVAVGDGFACARSSSDELVCWGRDEGSGAVVDAPGSARAVDAGGAYACAIAVEGTVQCWGTPSLPEGSDEAAPPAGDGFVAVSAAADHGCALEASGAPSCWGAAAVVDGTPGAYLLSVDSAVGVACGRQAGAGVVCWGDLQDLPAAVPGEWRDLAVGDVAVCALDFDDAAHCWPRVAAAE